MLYFSIYMYSLRFCTSVVRGFCLSILVYCVGHRKNLEKLVSRLILDWNNEMMLETGSLRTVFALRFFIENIKH